LASLIKSTLTAVTQRSRGIFRPRFMLVCSVALGLALVLVTVPVLPLRFGSLPQISMPWDKPEEPVKKKPQPRKIVTAVPVEQIKLMEQAGQELLGKISANPKDPSLQNQLGLIYLELGELDSAVQHFQKAISLSKVGLAELDQKGKWLASQGRYSEAPTVLVDSSRLNVELSAAHSNLARVYERLGQHSKVVLELDALNKEAVINTHAEARKNLDPPGYHRVTPAIVRLLARGQALMAQKQYVQAKQVFKNVIALDPNVALAHHQLGLAAALTSNPHLAVRELQAASALQPGDAVTHNNLGLAYQSISRVQEAQREFEKAVALDPNLVEAALNLGSAYCAAQNYVGAEHAFKIAVLHSPGSAMAHNSLASVLSMQGRYSDAIEEFEQTLAISPELASAHYGLGLALYNSKSYHMAVGEFKKALTLDPSMSSAHEKIEQASRRATSGGGAYGFN
jgi:tetratricopeptide (TPR) repeat protein